MTAAVLTEGGYESTCSLAFIERWLRSLYEPEGWLTRHHDIAPRAPRFLLPWVNEWRITPAIIGSEEELALLRRERRCVSGVEQCDYCRRNGPLRKRAKAMAATPPGPCTYCGEPDARTVDHVIPRCQGGTDHPSNLVRACRCCNSSKCGRTPEQWFATGRSPLTEERLRALPPPVDGEVA